MANPGIATIDVSDLKYALLTSDTGTTLTYGTLKDMAAAAQLTLEPQAGDTRELRGDGGVYASDVAVGSFLVRVRIGGLQPQVVADLWGHLLVQSGVTPNIKNTLTIEETPTKPFFKLEGAAKNVDQGDSHLVIYKVKADGHMPPMGLQDNEYGVLEFTGVATWTSATQVRNSVPKHLLVELVQNESSTAIA